MSTPKRQPATATLSERLRVIRIPTKEGEIYCFCSSNHCHALTAVLICHADLSKKKDLSICHAIFLAGAFVISKNNFGGSCLIIERAIIIGRGEWTCCRWQD